MVLVESVCPIGHQENFEKYVKGSTAPSARYASPRPSSAGCVVAARVVREMTLKHEPRGRRGWCSLTILPTILECFPGRMRMRWLFGKTLLVK